MFETIKSRLNDLDELTKKHPNTIPLKTAAEMMGVDARTLRNAIAQGAFPTFSTCWANTNYAVRGGKMVSEDGKRVFVISTLPFVEYLTGGAISKILKEKMEEKENDALSH